MAFLKAICYGSTGNDGQYPIYNNYLGKVEVSTLSSTSQSVSLPLGTKYVKFVTDATETVYYDFGYESATATTDSDELNAAEGETRQDRGVNNPRNNTLAARIA